MKSWMGNYLVIYRFKFKNLIKNLNFVPNVQNTAHIFMNDSFHKKARHLLPEIMN